MRLLPAEMRSGEEKVDTCACMREECRGISTLFNAGHIPQTSRCFHVLAIVDINYLTCDILGLKHWAPSSIATNVGVIKTLCTRHRIIYAIATEQVTYICIQANGSLNISDIDHLEGGCRILSRGLHEQPKLPRD